MQAMILAAGYGTRLKPYSLITPKPLFPVLNRPLLIATIERLLNEGFSSIIVNCHHLRQQVIKATESIPGIEIQDEPAILGTGGALGLASRSIADEPLLVSNSDIYHNANYRVLYENHISSGNQATLLLHNYPRFNTIEIEGGYIKSFRPSETTQPLFAYTGIQVVEPELIEILAPDTFSCIIEHYEALIRNGVRIGYSLAESLQWCDIGTPDDYLGLHESLLTGKMDIWNELRSLPGTAIIIDKDACCHPGCRFEEWVSVGKADIGQGAIIRRSVIWDGAHVADEAVVCDRIVTP